MNAAAAAIASPQLCALVLPGARVRVFGSVRVRDGAPVLLLRSIEVLEKQVVAAGVVGDRKARRKKRG